MKKNKTFKNLAIMFCLGLVIILILVLYSYSSEAKLNELQSKIIRKHTGIDILEDYSLEEVEDRALFYITDDKGKFIYPKTDRVLGEGEVSALKDFQVKLDGIDYYVLSARSLKGHYSQRIILLLKKNKASRSERIFITFAQLMNPENGSLRALVIFILIILIFIFLSFFITSGISGQKLRDTNKYKDIFHP